MDPDGRSAGTPPGWKDDPWQAGQWRYWDGSSWTPHTAPKSNAVVAVGPPPPQQPSSGVLQRSSPAQADPQRSSGLARLLGRKTEGERAAEAEYRQLLDRLSSGPTDLRGLPVRLAGAAERAGLRSRKAQELQDQAFRAVAMRMLADDLLTEAEELEFFEVADALGIDEVALGARFADLLRHLLIARVNDGRLPIVDGPRLMTKQGEEVHLEVHASLMKEVVHREYRGGSSGVSVPLGLGIRFNTGGFRGRSVVLGTSLQVADSGLLSVTDRRLVYHGQRKTQESRYDRLVSLEAYTDGIRVGVSNRQNASLYRVPSGAVVAAVVNAATQRA